MNKELLKRMYNVVDGEGPVKTIIIKSLSPALGVVADSISMNPENLEHEYAFVATDLDGNMPRLGKTIRERRSGNDEVMFIFEDGLTKDQIDGFYSGYNTEPED